ncbi:hypothetical protein [Halorubellus litoreus]|uniref:Uncharacterized protein n=1 Tax=Halorubellus litoreus TaxID=755308 RepID=A0ABD5VIN3_9EURY
MSESTRTTADGGDSDTLNVEDLFATDETDISIDDGESDDETVTPGSGTVTPDAEDTTADELFAQLREEQDDADQAHAVDELGDESPDEIMARADEEEAHVDQIDDAIRADEGALDDLLLTERREADGFLWVETEDDDATDDIGSLFAASDEASETQQDESTPADDESSPDATAAERSDDGFSLTDDDPGSFDARAATFDSDGDDFAVDAAAFEDDEDASTAPSEDDALANEGDPSDADEDIDGDDPEDTADEDIDGDDPEDTADDEQDSDDDGLAARIRSILTG